MKQSKFKIIWAAIILVALFLITNIVSFSKDFRTAYEVNHNDFDEQCWYIRILLILSIIWLITLIKKGHKILVLIPLFFVSCSSKPIYNKTEIWVKDSVDVEIEEILYNEFE